MSQLATLPQLSTVLAGWLLSALTNEKTEVLQPLPHLPPILISYRSIPHLLAPRWVPATLTFLFLKHSKIIPASRPGYPLFPSSRMSFPISLHASSCTSLGSQLKCHLLQESVLCPLNQVPHFPEIEAPEFKARSSSF